MTVAFSWVGVGDEGYGSARVPNFNEEASHCIKPPPDPPAMRVFVFEGRTHKFNTHKPLYESFTDFNDTLSYLNEKLYNYAI
jgi:hypothetical protein